MRNRTWIYLFALALALFGWSQYQNQHRSPEFQARLFSFDPEEVEKIEIQHPGQADFSLIRESGRWLASQETRNLPASREAVSELLHTLVGLESQSIVSVEPVEWDQYEVGPSSGLSLNIHLQDGRTEQLIMGKIAFEASQQRLISYVRIMDQNTVYAVSGFSVARLATRFNDFRPNQLLLLDQAVDSLSAYWQDSLQWVWPAAALHSADSQRVAFLRQALRDLKGAYFADDFDELTARDFHLASLEIYSANQSYTLHCYQDSTQLFPYIYHGDQFPEVWLASDSSGLYQHLFAWWKPEASAVNTAAATAQ